MSEPVVTSSQHEGPTSGDTTIDTSNPDVRRLADAALVHRYLDMLISRPDVYQVNVYKQLGSYTATITLTQKATSFQTVRIGTELFPEVDDARKTITAHGPTLYEAIRLVCWEFDNRLRRLAEREQHGR